MSETVTYVKGSDELWESCGHPGYPHGDIYIKKNDNKEVLLDNFENKLENKNK